MAQRVDPNLWRQTVRGRLPVAALMFGVWIAVVLGRLYVVQVLQHEQWVQRAKEQQTSDLFLPAPRGEILDRNGAVLAYSVDEDSLGGDPSLAGEPRAAVARLCEALGDCTPREMGELVAKFKPGKKFVRIRRRISQEQARRLRSLKLKWVVLSKVPWRYYPNKELAAQVLGFVGLDDQQRMDRGLAGLEQRFDSALRGKGGWQQVLKDSEGRPFLSTVGQPPVPGDTLELTIDKYLQFVAERELQAAVAEHQASGGCVVVMDPFSGEILALASLPTFNPNVYGDVTTEDQRRNRAVQDVYQPGSTFKLITAAAALEQKVVRPDEIIDTGNGTIRIGNYTVHDTHAHGAIPFREVITKSSNVGAIKVGQRLGAARLGQYVRALGFGAKLSPDFSGQEAGIVRNPEGWSEVTLSSVSFGYSLSVTPLQLTAAVSSVATGGELVEPRVLRAVIRGNTRTPVQRRVIRRALLPETAAQLTDIMEGVTEEGGTASAVRIDGFTIAGKTGTARRSSAGATSNLYRGSFVGFVPSRNPAVTVFVCSTPRGAAGDYGSVVAGPAFKRIAEAALQRLAVAPTINAQPPVLVGREVPRPMRPVLGPARPLRFVPALRRARRRAAAPGAAGPERTGRAARAVPPGARRPDDRRRRRHGPGAASRHPDGAGLFVPPLAHASHHRSPPGGAAMTLGELMAVVRDLERDGGRLPDGAAGRQVKGPSTTRAAWLPAPFLRAEGPEGGRLRACPPGAGARGGRRRRGGPRARGRARRRVGGGERRPPCDGARRVGVLRPAEPRSPGGRRHRARTARPRPPTCCPRSSKRRASGPGCSGPSCYRIGGEERTATRTTPEAVDVQRMLREMAAAGCGACVMEVSSHALSQRRVDETRFAAGIFTNLTRDHLDFHGDMESYFAAKRRLFEMLPAGAPAVVNLDDPRGGALAAGAARRDRLRHRPPRRRAPPALIAVARAACLRGADA